MIEVPTNPGYATRRMRMPYNQRSGVETIPSLGLYKYTLSIHSRASEAFVVFIEEN